MEYVEGILFLNPHVAAVKEKLAGVSTPWIVLTLNEKWGVLFPARFSSAEMQAKLLQISQEIPLLYCLDSEYAWGYRLYWQGKIQASFDAALDESCESDSPNRDLTPAQYANCNFEAFAIFDFDSETIHRLKLGITGDDALKSQAHPSLRSANLFMELVGMKEMSWDANYETVAYQMAHKDNDDQWRFSFIP